MSALNTLRLIEPKRYNYVDTYKKTNKPVWGFIAQQISDVLEYSVNLITDWIPNIYQLGNKSSLDKKDFDLLMIKLQLNKEEDLIYLLDKYPNFIEEELKFYKTKIK